jgi:ABC-type transport system involved in multi-copper enzyme maturation permease subunit
MSTSTYTTPSAPAVRATRLSGALSGEWTKLRTLPSTWRTAVITLVSAIGFAAAVVASQVSQWSTMSPQQHQAFDPTSISLSGIYIAAVLLGALAVRSVTAEYSTGMIRCTFTAMPGRRLVLAAKAATAAALVFPVALVCNVVGFGLGQQILAGKHLQVALSHPGVLQAIMFGAVAVSLLAIIGVGLGGVIRHTAGSTTALALMIIGSVTLGELLLPATFRQYLPGTAIQATVTVHRSAGLLTPGPAIAILGAYATIAMAAALIRVAHTDA